jgi:hypothetical protein
VKPVASLLMCMLMLNCILRASESVPYGHKDFVPTPERPLGWRADNNGYYPGATPPTEWREGTVTADLNQEKRVSSWKLGEDGQQGRPLLPPAERRASRPPTGRRTKWTLRDSPWRPAPSAERRP